MVAQLCKDAKHLNRLVEIFVLAVGIICVATISPVAHELGVDDSCAIIVVFDYDEGLPERNYESVDETPKRIRFNIILNLVTEEFARTGKRELNFATYPNDYAIFDWMQDCPAARQSTIDLLDAYWAKLSPEQREISPPYSIWHRPATEKEVEQLIVPELTERFIRRMDGLPE